MIWPWTRRYVRLHQEHEVPSLEGLLSGWPRRNAGHYVLRMPGVVQSPGSIVPLEALEVLIPKERVVWMEVLRK